MRLRENLREYVSELNQITADTGFPMCRPMFLQFPDDPACAGPDVEDQYMFGPSWLVAPVTVFGATSRSVYLPDAGVNHTWVYFFNGTDVGAAARRVTINTPISEFPLFERRPIAPPPSSESTRAVLLYSTARSDAVLCVSDFCLTSNAPSEPGAYVVVPGGANFTAWTTAPGGSVTVGGVAYPAAPLNGWYSNSIVDNLAATNSTPPDPSYLVPGGGVVYANGYVLATAAPGSIPLRVWKKAGAGVHVDYLTTAGATGEAWARANGYVVQWQGGWVMP